MLRNQQLDVPPVSPDDLIPALPEIAFHIPHCRSFEKSVSIMPVVRSALLFVPPQRRGVVMEVCVPTVVIATQFNQHIDATDKRMGAIYDRDFLMWS